jgi:diguanylate cyclase (GGDEF)-like protein
MHNSFDDIDKLTYLFLHLRLQYYKSNINKQLNEFQEHLDKHKSAPSHIARSDLIRHWIVEFEEHCHQIVEDFIYLVETFHAFNVLDFLKQKLDSHITLMAKEFNQLLSEYDIGGLSVTSSERTRISNMVSSIKAISNQNWQERTKHLLLNNQTREMRPLDFKDLDDRLPVRRRGAFDHDLKVTIDKASQSQETISLVMIDIDHFKKVNDKHGHHAGDLVLLGVAQCLVRRLAHKGHVYRYGGEEFAIILPTYSTDEAVGLSERLRKDIEEKTIGTNGVKITASFGVASFPDDAKDAISLIKKADTALYASKKNGRNRVKAFGD